MSGTAYQPKRPSRCESADIRGLRYNLRIWGDDDAPLLLLLHGGLDASITFQFLVDAMDGRWRIVAPDWRGFGASEWAPQGYWFQDYIADLDALTDLLSLEAPVRLVGHSLGGNAAGVYAGVRPERVSHLVSLDGFGIADGDPDIAPARMTRWLDSFRTSRNPRAFASLDDVAERLVAANPRLTPPRARLLAAHVTRPNDDGTFAWAFDPRHRAPFPTVHRFAEWAACYRQVQAPVLWISAGLNRWMPLDEVERRRALLPRSARLHVPGSGHNLQHDAPELIAPAIDAFMASGRLPANGTLD